MKSNNGSEKAPSPKSVMVFNGIKGLLASGPGTKQAVKHTVVRPEKNEGAKIPQDAMKKTPTMSAAKSSVKVKSSGKVNVRSNIRPEGGIKRDEHGVVKPK